MTTPPDDTTEGEREHANNHANSHASEHGGAVEGLRERIQASFGPAMRLGLQDAELYDELGAQRIEEWITHITDWVLAALAADPGDLPARMAAEMQRHGSTVLPGECLCGVRVDDWDEHLAEAAMSVRWEDRVRTEAENERLRAAKRHLSERISTGQEGWNEISRERDRLEREVERLRAELTEARAAAEQSAAEGNQDLARFNQYREWTHEVVAERDALKAAIAEQIPRTLNAAADKLHALPETDGAALKGPYWYRQGFTQAADLLRDWADYPAALDAPETPEGGKSFSQISYEAMVRKSRAKSPVAPETPGDADV